MYKMRRKVGKNGEIGGLARLKRALVEVGNRSDLPSWGFTLIELLIVMLIIGLLATIGLGSFRTSQIKARDAQRKHDLIQVQKALEIYYNDYGGYLLTDEFPDGGGSWTDDETVYLKEVPTDPRFGDYPYASGDGTDYRLYARLENTNDPCFRSGGSACSTDGYDGTECGGEPCNYRVTSPNVVPE